MRSKAYWLILLFYLIDQTSSIGQNTNNEIDSILKESIDEITISSNRIVQNTDLLPWSKDIIELADIDKFQNNLQQLLDRNAGMRSFNGENYAQDLRLDIRGFGARAAFGIRGLRLYLDGIPLTSPDGTSQTDEISNYGIKEIEVIRNPSSSMFGNAAGGSVFFKSENSFALKEKLNGFLNINNLGSIGSGVILNTNGINSSNQLQLNAQSFKSEREFNDSQSFSLYNKWAKSVSERFKVEIIGNLFYSPKSEDPGSLNIDSFTENPYQANNRNLLFDAGEEVNSQGLAMKAQVDFSKSNSLNSLVYIKHRDFVGRLPFMDGGQIDLNRWFGGFSNRYTLRNGRNDMEFTLGQTLEYQRDNRQRYDNIEGIRSDSVLDQIESVYSLGIYQQFFVKKSRWIFQEVARIDRIGFNLNDNFLIDGVQEGTRTHHKFNYTLGVSFDINQNNAIYVNLSTGFETPTLNELTNNPDASNGLNNNLQPEESTQIEGGIKYNIDRLKLSIASFYIKIKDQIIPYELEAFPGRNFYRNAGKSTRRGIEAVMNYNFSAETTVNFNYTFSDFFFNEYVVDGVDLEGNLLPIISRHRINFFISTEIVKRIEINSSLQYNSGLFLNDENSVKENGFFDGNLQMVYQPIKDRSIKMGLNFNNIFNTREYSNLRANAFGGRFYEAASSRFVGLFINFSIR